MEQPVEPRKNIRKIEKEKKLFSSDFPSQLNEIAIVFIFNFLNNDIQTELKKKVIIVIKIINYIIV